MDTATAIGTAGSLLTTFQIALIATPFIFGFFVDRFTRTTLLLISCGMAGIAFMATALVSNIFSIWAYIIVALVGVAETSLIISIQAVMGEEAPPALRGSALGVFAFLGSVSVVVISFAGGQMFDRLGYAAPFIMVGVLNLAFSVVGCIVIAGSQAKAAAHRSTG